MSRFSDWLQAILGGATAPWTTLDTAFDVSTELERRAGVLYDAFAQRFADDERSREFWQHLAADERRHQNALIFTRNILKEMPPEKDRIRMDIPRLQLLAQMMDAAMERARSTEFNIDEAVGIAEQIETSEMDHVMETLTHLPPHPVVLGILEDIKKGTGQHDRRLFDFVRSLEADRKSTPVH